MTEKVQGLLKIHHRFCTPYNYSLGDVLSHFYTELREKHRILGRRCPECRGVYVPPVDFCRVCFVDAEEWTEVSERGEVWNYTIVQFPFANQPPVVKVPYAYVMVRLDGADTSFYHILQEVDLRDVRIGMRIEAVWERKERVKSSDVKHIFSPIRYFRPVR